MSSSILAVCRRRARRAATRLFAATVLTSLGVSATAAQATADSGPAAKREMIRGVVFDSLASEPLASAFVIARPSGQSTTTDSLGRFSLLTEGEVTEVLVYHDALDRMGMGALGLARPARTENWTNLYIATPSLATLWPQLCESRRPRGNRSVIIMGTARLSDNTTRVAGAKVIVQWAPLIQKGDGLQLESVEVITDSIGNYVACEVEEFVEPSLIALSSEAQSGVISMAGDMRPIRRMDLVLVRTEAAAQRATVRGKVVNSKGAPMRDFAVSIDGRDGRAVTGPDGTFPARQRAAGLAHAVRARHRLCAGGPDRGGGKWRKRPDHHSREPHGGARRRAGHRKGRLRRDRVGVRDCVKRRLGSAASWTPRRSCVHPRCAAPSRRSRSNVKPRLLGRSSRS